MRWVRVTQCDNKENHFTTSPLQTSEILIIGLCNLLRVYQINIGRTSVRNTVFFSARFYCALLTLHVAAPFGGHLQVVHKHKNIQGSHYIFKGSVE
jgi:hypothetical protein